MSSLLFGGGGTFMSSRELIKAGRVENVEIFLDFYKLIILINCNKFRKNGKKSSEK